MSTELATKAEAALVAGDLSKLSADERLAYYKAVCESVGLNPLTKPFDYLTLNNKMVLYATRTATDQLRKIHGVSTTITRRENVGDVHVVTAKAQDSSGRVDESTGAVSIGNLKGDALANALMKAETKAKRRVTLSICGLGMLDESEVETIPNVQVNGHHEQPKQLPPTVNNSPQAPMTLDKMISVVESAKFPDALSVSQWIARVSEKMPEVADIPDELTTLPTAVRESVDMGEQQDFVDLLPDQVVKAKAAILNWMKACKPKKGN